MMADDISKNKPKLVVAIDFGTSGSGFTFQLRSHYETSKTSHIFENADWGQGVRRSKTSTCLLIRPDFQNKKNTTAYFGETAEIEYNKFKEDDLEEWYFFRNFKMQLYDKQTIYSDLMIRGDKGKELPAYYVFGESIRCIKEKALEYIGQWNDAYLNETIKWVITVPAIWSEGAKQIMRKAAEEADIPPELTSIALEPEAAGIYSVEMEEELAGACKEGEPYFIVDMGGGTVDITTLRSLGGKINQLQPADGCDSGGEAVNEKMFELMSNMFGKKLWTEFADERSFCFVEFRKSVEKAKCSIKTNKSNPKTDFFNLHLPGALLTDFAKEKGCSVKDAIKLSSKGRMEIEMGGLKVQADVLREIMDETVQKVKSHINKEIDELQKKGHDVCTVILVGGFSSSDFVFQKIKEYIQTQKPRIHVRRPPYSQIAVMNGAVLYGQDESILASRSLMMTFGIRATRLYTKDFPVERKVEINGKAYIQNIFSVHARRGQTVLRDEWISHTGYFPVTQSQTKAVLQVFASKERDPKYTDEEGCFNVGHYTLDLSADRFTKKCTEIAFSFGTTEIKIRARNTDTNYKIVERIVLNAYRQ